jgi:hypothetical protein
MAFRNQISRVSQLIADSIVGATFATAAAGKRWVISNGAYPVNPQTILGYSGHAGETVPSTFIINWSDAHLTFPDQGRLDIQGPSSQGQHQAGIGFVSNGLPNGGGGAPQLSQLFLAGDQIFAQGSSADTAMTIAGTVLIIEQGNTVKPTCRMDGNSIGAPDTAFGTTTETLRLVTPGFKAINGRRYRIVGKSNPQSTVVNDFCLMNLKYDTVNTGITGTTVDTSVKEHPIANRCDTLMSFGEFLYTGATGTTIYAKMTLYNGGTGVGTDASGSFPFTQIYVEQF